MDFINHLSNVDDFNSVQIFQIYFEKNYDILINNAGKSNKITF